jgi:hypothetical protein
VNIAAADAAGGYPEQHLSRAGPSDRHVLDAGFSRSGTRFHESLHLCTSEDVTHRGYVAVRTHPGHHGVYGR